MKSHTDEDIKDYEEPIEPSPFWDYLLSTHKTFSELNFFEILRFTITMIILVPFGLFFLVFGISMIIGAGYPIGGLLFFWSRVFEMVRIFFGFREDWLVNSFPIFHVKTGEEIFHGLTFRLFENLFDSCKDKEIMDARNQWWSKHVSEKMVREFKE